jgi:hypothetical protein
LLDAQCSGVIIVVVQLGAVKIYVAAVEVLVLCFSYFTDNSNVLHVICCSCTSFEGENLSSPFLEVVSQLSFIQISPKLTQTYIVSIWSLTILPVAQKKEFGNFLNDVLI